MNLPQKLKINNMRDIYLFQQQQQSQQATQQLQEHKMQPQQSSQPPIFHTYRTYCYYSAA